MILTPPKPTKKRLRLPKKFQRLFKPKRYKVYYGGRGGAKSWAFAIALVLLSCIKPLRILCAREFQNSISDSSMQLIKDTIYRLGLSHKFKILDKQIIGKNGSRFFFKGLHTNISSVKSMEGIDIVWVEEAHSVSEHSWEILIPTIRKPGSEIWVSFNPDSPDDPTYQRFVTNVPPDAISLHVTWRDNPWFTDELRKEMEWDYLVDPERAEHIWEGVPRVHSDAQIMRGKFSVKTFDIPQDVDWLLGADWGFSVDPTVVGKFYIWDNCLYICEEAYGVGVDLDDTPQLFDRVLPKQNWPVRADSSRPETISFMNRRGYNIIKAKKPKGTHGSIEDGISYIRSFRHVYIHPRCKHFAQEFKLYSYKVDKRTGDVLPVILDKHNHCIDALRYALEPLMIGAALGKTGVSAGDLGL